jgi:hypothetical protein
MNLNLKHQFGIINTGLQKLNVQKKQDTDFGVKVKLFYYVALDHIDS